MSAWDRAALAWLLLVVGVGGARIGLFAASIHDWLPLVVIPASVVVVMCPWYFLAGLIHRRARSLDAVSPEAAAAIRTSLANAGLPVPGSIRLDARGVATAEFPAGPWRRPRLALGLTSLLALPGEDLPIVAAHAMAVGATDHPSLTAAVWKKRRRHEALRVVLRARGNGSSRKARRTARFLAATDVFAEQVRQRADAAAVRVAGSADAATVALYRHRSAFEDFNSFLNRFRLQILRRRRIPADLYAGWLEGSWDGTPEWALSTVQPAVRPFFADHPGFAAVDPQLLHDDAAIRRRHGVGAPSSQYVLHPKVAKRMAVLAAKTVFDNALVRATDVSRIDPARVYPADPPDTWSLEGAAAVLGRSADRVDVLELILAGRLPEIVSAMPGGERLLDRDLPDGGFVRARVIAELAAGALEAHGFRQSDVFREWWLTGPTGETEDVGRVITEALASDDGMDRLRALLAG